MRGPTASTWHRNHCTSRRTHTHSPQPDCPAHHAGVALLAALGVRTRHCPPVHVAHKSQDKAARTICRQRAIFQPRGLAGHAYWRVIPPFHGIVFGGMVRNIAAAAQRADARRGAAGGAQNPAARPLRAGR
ncbi:MAG: DUF2867 domain-containing protein [Streptosporangiaceae bacterium]